VAGLWRVQRAYCNRFSRRRARRIMAVRSRSSRPGSGRFNSSQIRTQVRSDSDDTGPGGGRTDSPANGLSPWDGLWGKKDKALTSNSVTGPRTGENTLNMSESSRWVSTEQPCEPPAGSNSGSVTNPI
jgi:hypothetical protein